MKLVLISINVAPIISTLNLNALRDSAKRAGILQWL